jgi:hypothetical protein
MAQSEETSGPTNDNSDSPSTTSGESGTMTPRSEGPESQGINSVQGLKYAR